MSEYKTQEQDQEDLTQIKQKTKMSKRCRSMPTLEVTCLPGCKFLLLCNFMASCWHVSTLYTEGKRSNLLPGSRPVFAVVTQLWWRSAVPTGHSWSCGYLQDIWPCGPSQGIVVYPPEVLVVLQDSVEPKMNSLYICIFKITFLVSSSHLFKIFLPPQEWLLHCLAGGCLFFPFDLYLLCCHHIMIIYT